MAAVVKRIKGVSYDEESGGIVVTLDVDGEPLQLEFTFAQAEHLIDELYVWLDQDDDLEDEFDDGDSLDVDW